MKVLIHDGLGIWLCARRLHREKFHWSETLRGKQLKITDEQLTTLLQDESHSHDKKQLIL